MKYVDFPLPRLYQIGSLLQSLPPKAGAQGQVIEISGFPLPRERRVARGRLRSCGETRVPIELRQVGSKADAFEH